MDLKSKITDKLKKESATKYDLKPTETESRKGIDLLLREVYKDIGLVRKDIIYCASSG